MHCEVFAVRFLGIAQLDVPQQCRNLQIGYGLPGLCAVLGAKGEGGSGCLERVGEMF